MRKGAWLSGVFVFLLTVCSTAFAAESQELAIDGFGRVTVPAGVEVIELASKNSPSYALLVKVNGVWRTNTIVRASKVSFPGEALGDFAANMDKYAKKVEETIGDKFASDRVLQSSPAKVVTVGNKRFVVANRKVLVQAFAMNIDFYLFETGNGLRGAAFMCADGDAAYWREFNNVMIASVKE